MENCDLGVTIELSVALMGRYSIPNIPEFTSELPACFVSSEVDLVEAFHQIQAHPSDNSHYYLILLV